MFLLVVDCLLKALRNVASQVTLLCHELLDLLIKLNTLLHQVGSLTHVCTNIFSTLGLGSLRRISSLDNSQVNLRGVVIICNGRYCVLRLSLL